jgi:branched-chain amino acid transport system permease protein
VIQVLEGDVALIAIYAIVILGLGFIAGMGGLFSVCQAGMFGIGAFVFSGLYAYGAPTDLLVAMPVAIVCGAGISVVVALVALRVSGDFFVVASFALQIVMTSVLYNWSTVSGGPSGAYGLPSPTIGGVSFASPGRNEVLIVVVAAVLFAFAWWLRRAPFGKLVRAMGADEPALQAAGFEPARLKLSTFAIGGMLAAAAGVLYASYIGIAQVDDFDINVSIVLLAAVLVGGSRSLWGSVIGGFVFIGLPRLLTLVNTPASLAGPLQELIFGGLLVAVMMFLPEGIASGPARLRGRVNSAGRSSVTQAVER